MEPLFVGIIGMVALVALVIYGVHIAVTLGAVGFIGLVLILGINKAIPITYTVLYSNIATFDFAVIPLFVLMGMLATSVGVSTATYETLSLWLGKIRGGLGMATVWACAAFGTLNGSAIVTASVFARASSPEMRRNGYDKSIAYGLVSASGNIGQLIPPSVLIVIYGALSGDSIGRLLMAGISPGLALGVLFCLTIYIIAVVRPDLVPRDNKETTWKERFISLKNFIPVALVALIIIGGIFSGIFSSSEAGAIGCVVFFIYALIFKAPMSAIKKGIMETVLTCGMIFILLAGAGIFAKFLTVSGIAGVLTGLATNYTVPPIVFMLIVMVILIFLGCFLDAISIMSITLPMLLPTVKVLGIDPIQFAMVFIIAQHCGGLTPPVGACVFTVKAVAEPDVTIGDIFMGALPFLIAMIVACLIYILFPSLSTFIPNLMFN